ENNNTVYDIFVSPIYGLDSQVDTVTLRGNLTPDVFSVKTVMDDRLGVPVLQAQHTGGVLLVLENSNNANDELVIQTYATGDSLSVNNTADTDLVDASGVTDHVLKTLNIMTGVGDDLIVGSSFTDYIQSGLGDDIVTGGPGVDIFADAGGDDTLLEVRNLDLGLHGNYYLAGQIQDGTTDVWLAGTEVESLLQNGDPIFEHAILM